MIRHILIIGLVLSIHLQTVAQNVTINDLLSAPFPSNLVTAPNHNKIAFVLNEEGIRNIWVAAGPSYIPKKVTSYNVDRGRNLSQLSFNQQGTHLTYRLGDGPNRSGEYPNPTSHPEQKTEETELFKIDLLSGIIKSLGKGSSSHESRGSIFDIIHRKGKVYFQHYDDKEAELLFDVRGNVTDHAESPGTSLKQAFISSRGDRAFAGIYDWEKEKIKWLLPSVDNDQSLAWSPDGSKLAFLRIPSEKDRVLFTPVREAQPWSIMVYDTLTQQTSAIWTAPKGTGSAFRFINSPSQIFWTCNNKIVFPYEGNGFTNLYAINSDGSDLTNISNGTFEVQFVSYDPHSCSVLYSSNEGDIDRQHIWEYNFNSKKKAKLSEGAGVEWAPVRTIDGTTFVLRSEAKTPSHVGILKNGELEPLMPLSIPKAFSDENLPSPEQVVFESPDGMKIHGQLFKPSNVISGKKLPAVMFFHGGSRRQMLLAYHHSGYYHNMYALNQYMASKGYVVLAVNFRSGIGYGMEFREALNYGANGASEYNDVIGGANYLKSRIDVDPDRIGLYGGSYGGYLTAMGLSKNSDVFAAGVDIHGVHDWNEVIKNFMPSYNAEKLAEASKTAYESSPMFFMDGWKSPVLLIHGDDDRNVPFSETVDVVEQLRKRDVYFEQLIFPDEVHGFLLHENWQKAMNATFDFFERNLKNKK